MEEQKSLADLTLERERLNEQPVPPLDVERLGTAMHNTGVTLCDNGGPGSSLDDVAAEYERLAGR